MENKSVLTNEELNVIELSTKFWNAYNKLEEQHPCDKEEFCHALHICQHLVMIRGIRRLDSENFPIYNKIKNN